MAASVRKKKAHRRVAAINFLSNISLDGTYKDTQYGFLQLGVRPKSKFIDENRTVEENLSVFTDEKLPDKSESESTLPDKDGELKVIVNDDTNRAASGSQINDQHCDNNGSKEHRTNTPILTSLNLKSESGHHHKNGKEISSNGDHRKIASLKQQKRPKHRRSATSVECGTIAVEARDKFVDGAHTPVYTKVVPLDKASYRKKLFPQSIPDSGINNTCIFDTPQDRKRHRSSSISTDSGDSLSTSRQISYSAQREVKIYNRFTDKIRNERVLMTTNQKGIIAFSTLPYRRDQIIKEFDRTRKASGHRPISSVTSIIESRLIIGLQPGGIIEEDQDISYSQFLVPSLPSKLNKRSTILEGSLATPQPAFDLPFSPGLELEVSLADVPYDPNLLDDPELIAGKHRTLMTFSSYMTSVVDYCRPSDLKRELNEQFKERFPQINLTLTKLRSLKKDLRRIANKCSIDLWTVATAYVYYEKLILKGMINKSNRRLCAGASLMLGYKLNDGKPQDTPALIDEVTDWFKLSRRDLLAFEVAVLVALEFSLHIPDSEVYPHYQRLTYQS